MPQLAPVVDDIATVAEPLRTFYVQKDGKYHVDLAGAPAGFVPAADLATVNGRLVEFRDNNVALTKKVGELEPLVKKFEGIDPEAARAALESVGKLKEKGVKSPDDLAAAISTAVQAAVKPLTEQITSITTTAAEDRKRADSMTLRTTLGDKFIKAGGHADALDFIVSKSSGVFVVEGGTVKAAANQFSADRPGEALSVEEWLTRQTKEASFAFKSSGGGGAQPSTTAGGVTRPAGQLVLLNPTPQQLGEHGLAIKQGKMRVEYDK